MKGRVLLIKGGVAARGALVGEVFGGAMPALLPSRFDVIKGVVGVGVQPFAKTAS